MGDKKYKILAGLGIGASLCFFFLPMVTVSAMGQSMSVSLIDGLINGMSAANEASMMEGGSEMISDAAMINSGGMIIILGVILALVCGFVAAVGGFTANKQLSLWSSIAGLVGVIIVCGALKVAFDMILASVPSSAAALIDINYGAGIVLSFGLYIACIVLAVMAGKPQPTTYVPTYTDNTFGPQGPGDLF